MASDVKSKPSRNYNLRISDKTINLLFLNCPTHQQEKMIFEPISKGPLFIKFNFLKLNHMNLFLSDHLHVLVNSRLLLLACRRESVDFHQEKKREVGILSQRVPFFVKEFENIIRLIPSPLFCSISSSFLMLSSLAVNVCFCVSIRISNSCEDLHHVLQWQSKRVTGSLQQQSKNLFGCVYLFQTHNCDQQ